MDSFSPSQIADDFGGTWLEREGSESRYDVFDFSHRDVPETIIQESPGGGNVVKSDQLPNGASEEDVIRALEQEDYSKESELGDFEIYTTVDSKEAGAIGDGHHALAFNFAGRGPSTNTQVEYLNTALEEYMDEDQSLEDTQDVADRLDVQDSFTSFRKRDWDIKFIDALEFDNQPIAGAVTVNVEEGEKYAAWKFEDESTARQAYNLLTSGTADTELDNNFTQITEREGRYLTAAGEYTGENNFETGSLETPLT